MILYCCRWVVLHTDVGSSQTISLRRSVKLARRNYNMILHRCRWVALHSDVGSSHTNVDEHLCRLLIRR